MKTAFPPQTLRPPKERLEQFQVRETSCPLYSRLRQGGVLLLLICLYAVFDWREAPAATFSPLAYNGSGRAAHLSLKGKKVGLAECVHIFSAPPDEQAESLIGHRLYLIRIIRQGSKEITGQVWEQDRIVHGFLGFVEWNVPARKPRETQPSLYFVGWRGPKIFQSHPCCNLAVSGAIQQDRPPIEPNISAQLSLGSALSEPDGIAGGVSSLFGGLGGLPRRVDITLAGDEQRDCCQNEQRSENGKPFRVFGNGIFGGIVGAWRRASPNSLFVGTLLLSVCSLGLVALFLHFFGGKQ